MARSNARRFVRYFFIGLSVVCVVAATGWVALRYIRPVVSVTTIVTGPVIRAFYATGTISPEREFPIRANSPGTITQVLVDKGIATTLGQPLAIITDPGLLFELEKAKAELLEKEQRAAADSPVLGEFDSRIESNTQLLEIAQREVARNQQLMERNAGTSFDFDRSLDRTKTLSGEIASLRAQRQSRFLELQRELSVAKAQVQTARSNVELQTLRSPVTGVVLDRPMSQGTRVAVNEVLMRVADIDPTRLVMRAAVDEEDITRVRAAQVVQISLYAFPGRLFTGQVRKIYDQADSTRRTFEVDIAVDLPDKLLQPGMTGELAFILERRDDVQIIPTQAIQNGKIYVVRGGTLVAIDAVAGTVVGASAIDRTEIVGGLSKGDQIVISPVSPDMLDRTVRIVLVDPRAAVGLDKPQPKASTNVLR